MKMAMTVKHDSKVTTVYYECKKHNRACADNTNTRQVTTHNCDEALKTRWSTASISYTVE